MHRLYLYLLLSLALVGCSQIEPYLDPEQLFDPPRMATQTARAQTPFPTQPPVPPTAESIIVPTRTPPPIITVQGEAYEPQETLVVWFNESSAAHRAVAAEIGAAFTAETDIRVEIIFVDSDNVLALARSAKWIGRLPDIIFHHNEYTGSLLDENILDPLLANTILQTLDPDTFMPGILDEMPDVSGLIATIPSDGWQQLLLYRADWFEEAELETPDDYAAIAAGAAALHKLLDTDNYDELLAATEQNISGIVVPTESDLLETQRVFEHFAVANGCALGDQNHVTLQQPACLAALDFYYDVVNQYSPPGYQTGQSAIQAYLDGRTAMIVTSPAVLPMLAGSDELYQPSCNECTADPLYLTKNTGFVTNITGSAETGRRANLHRINTLGLTQNANKERTEQFVTYWFDQAYADWLAIAPEHTVPMRVTDGDTDWLDVWRTLPMTGADEPLAELFDDDLDRQLIAGLARSERWGEEAGNGVLVSHVYEQLMLAPRLQRMLSNFTDSEQTLLEMTEAVLTAAPGYSRPPTPAPTTELEE